MSTPLPTGGPAQYTVRKVEQKRTLPPKDGKPAKMILRLGLEGADGTKDWAELFSDADPATWPAEGETLTLILSEPDNPNWSLKAQRPGRGGGGGRGRSPAETKAIQRQHSQEMALRALRFFYGNTTLELTVGNTQRIRGAIEDWTDWFEANIAGTA